MKITKSRLRRIILEEMRNVKRQRLQEAARNRPVKITPEYLNRIIREEYSAFQNSDTERSDSYDVSLVNNKDFTVLTVGTDYNDGLKSAENSSKFSIGFF